MVHHLGCIPFDEAWRLQETWADEIAREVRPPTLLLLEHPHTFTFGRRGKTENLLWDQNELKRRGVAVHWIDRGGDITYHGPGQLVGYPLLPLSPIHPVSPSSPSLPIPKADYLGYLRKLEDVLIISLQRMDIEASRIEGLTGVWIPERQAKIAAIGIKVDARGVSRHGFALNVNPDMSYWEGIVACGLKDYAITSLADLLDKVPPMQSVMDAVQTAFGEIFGYKMVLANS